MDYTNDWWEDVDGWSYSGQITKRCGCSRGDICEHWCDGHKTEAGHLKDECTYENCVLCECQMCGLSKKPTDKWCEACASEEELG